MNPKDIIDIVSTPVPDARAEEKRGIVRNSSKLNNRKPYNAEKAKRLRKAAKKSRRINRKK